MDLRQRRKTETTRLIREAAVALARQHGVDGTTVEAICEKAGVSQRTFFNYFAFKDAVFMMPPPPLPEAAVARFLVGTGDPMIELIDLMVAQAQEIKDTHWLGQLLHEIVDAHPRLMPLQMAEFQKFEAQLAGLIGQRRGLAEADVISTALAGAIVGATRSGMDRWRHDPDADFPSLLSECLHGVLAFIRGGHPGAASSNKTSN